MKINLAESELIVQLYEALSKEQDWRLTNENWVTMYKCLSEAIYEYLSLVQDKDKKVALVFTYHDQGNSFLAAAMKEYIPNEDNEDIGGNWAFTYTFNQADVYGDPEHTDIRYSSDPQFFEIMNHLIKNSDKTADGIPCGPRLNEQFAAEMFDYLFRFLLKWLDTNAREKEAMDLVLEDHFVASVSIENGEKVFAMFPHGRAKSKIKNDDAVAEGIE